MTDKVVDIEALFLALDRYKVTYILVGSSGAIAHGAKLETADLDICIATDIENLQQIASMLRALNARLLREPARGMQAIKMDDWTTLRLADPNEHHLFGTSFGQLDLLPQPFSSGTGSVSDYEQLSQHAVTMVAFGLKIQVAAFDEIATFKLSSDRPQDRVARVELQRIKTQVERGESRDYGLEQFAAERPRTNS